MLSRVPAVAALVMCAGAAVSQTEWVNAAGGSWNTASNWSPMDVPNSLVETALLGDLGVAYTVGFNLSASILGVTLHMGNTLEIEASRIFSLGSGGFINNGLIIINPTGSSVDALFRAIDPTSITGTGHIELNSITADLGDARLSGTGSGVLTIGPGQVVAGSGLLTGPIMLEGTINPDRNGRDIQLAGDIDASAGGIIFGSGGGKAMLSGTIVGGAISSVEAQGAAATINGSTSTGDNGVRPGATLSILGGGLVNEGRWVVNTSASTTNALVRSTEPATIYGSGTIELNSITADINDAQLSGSVDATLTIGQDQTVNGSGSVSGPVHLLGTINADRKNRDIAVSGSITASSSGTMQGTNDGTIAFQGSLAGGHLAGGVEAQLSTGNLDGVTSTGINGLRPGATLSVINAGLVNNGTWIINTTGSTTNALLRSTTPSSISGIGKLELNSITADFNDAQIAGAAGATLTIGSGQTISGSGAVYGPMVLDGAINADRTARDIVVSGSINAGIDGMLWGSNGGAVSLRGTLSGGHIAGNVEADFSQAIYDGVSASGVNGVRPGATLSLAGGGLSNNGTIVVNTVGSSTNAHMRSIAPAAIVGDGNIELNSITADLGDAQIAGATDAELTIGSTQTISGSGSVAGPIVLDGMISADRNGREIAVSGQIDASAGGVMQGTNGGTVTLSGMMTGGVWLGGVEGSGSASRVDATTLEGVNGVRHGATLNIGAGGMTNNGTLVINPAGSSTNARLNTSETVTIGGSGIILLNATTADLGDAQMGTTGDGSVTIGQHQTIAGRGALDGSLTILGTLDPGSDSDRTSLIHIGALPTLADTTQLKFDIAGAAINDYDRLTTSNQGLSLDGTLEIELLDGYVPPFNTRFTLISGQNIVGQPHTVLVPQVGLGIFRLQITATKVEAVWTCEADVNADGVLDFFDVQYFLNAYTSQALYGDYNGDGLIDFFDVQAFLNDYALGCF